jgi:hypothetical protein
MLERGPDSQVTSAAKSVGAAADVALDVGDGALKGVVNTWIGMNNLMADYKVVGAKHIQPYEPENMAQEGGMIVSERVLLFVGLKGRASVGGVVVAEAKTTTVAAAQGANAASRSQTPAQMAETLSNQIGKNSVPYRTSSAMGHIDLKGKAHFDKASGTRIPTPHVQERSG